MSTKGISLPPVAMKVWGDNCEVLFVTLFAVKSAEFLKDSNVYKKDSELAWIR